MLFMDLHLQFTDGVRPRNLDRAGFTPEVLNDYIKFQMATLVNLDICLFGRRKFACMNETGVEELS